MKNRINDELENLIKTNFGNDVIGKKFLHRLKEGSLTKDENPKSHFCVYFAAYDSKAKQIFIGHHKKSGLWLFNGGHIDKGEIPKEALEREIKEEWDLEMQAKNIGNPLLLTITKINNPAKQPCRAHYDIWYFVSVNKKSFNPSKENLAEEFYNIKWITTSEAKHIVTEINTLKAIKFIEDKFNSQIKLSL